MTEPAKLRKKVAIRTSLFTGFAITSLKLGFRVVSYYYPSVTSDYLFLILSFMTLAGSLIKKRVPAAKINERTERTEKVDRHPMDLIKMMEREDMPHPTKFPHWRIELAVARFESGKYSPSREKDSGLKAAAMVPMRTLLAARNGKESILLIIAIVPPVALMASARPIFLLTNGVIPP